MARLKLGAIITDASGKLGGHVVGKNNGQFILKNKSVNNNNRSTSQIKTQSQTKYLMSFWSKLTDDQRREWYLQLDAYKHTNIFSDVVKYNGFTLFQKLNQGRLNCNLPVLSIPNVVAKPSLPVFLNITATTSSIIVQSNAFNSSDYIQLYASKSLSKGLSNPKKFMRVINISKGDLYNGGLDVFSSYVSKFGQPQNDTRLFFGIKTISETSGFSNGVLIISSPVLVGGVTVDFYKFQDDNQFVFMDNNNFIFN